MPAKKRDTLTMNSYFPNNKRLPGKGGNSRHYRGGIQALENLSQKFWRRRGKHSLQVFWREAGVPGKAGQHTGTDFFFVMEGKDHIGPAIAGKSLVGTGLSLDGPAKTQQSRQYA